MNWSHVLLLVAFAFAINMPLGQWRSRQRKFSPKWLVGVHLSIPFIFLLRVAWHLPLAVIPAQIACVAAGQYLGARLPVFRREVR
ncbi:MAG: hypothetical protein HY677_00475 [Chloroflexi bacterium]|nr:hypothetical protein [Chloroflexota bacterium]